MARQIKAISYDSDNDIFSLHNGDSIKFSLDVGDFILDISHKNLVCGIEIMDASENLGVSQSFLKSIKNMKMSVSYRTNHVYVLLSIVFKQREKEVNITLPLTLDLGHKSPKTEVLVYK